MSQQDNSCLVTLTVDCQQTFSGHLPTTITSWQTTDSPAEAGKGLFEQRLTEVNLRRAWDIIQGQSGRRFRLWLWIDEGAPELHTLPRNCWGLAITR